MEENELPRKSVYQIYLTDKLTDEVLHSVIVVAYSISEAIERAKIGSVIKALGLTLDMVEFYTRAVGVCYSGETVVQPLSKTPELTVTEKANVGKTPDSRLAELENRLQAQELRTENIEVTLQVADKLPLEL